MNKLLEGWKENYLGQIFEFESKSGRKAGTGNGKGKYKFFTSSDTQSKFIDEFDFEGEHLIFSTGGMAGLHYCNEKFSTSTDCFVVKVDQNEVFTKYVYYYLSKNIHILKAGFKGAGLKHISKEYLRNVKIQYPINKTKQMQIIHILDKASEVKNLRAKADELTKDFLKSVFIEMFGDPKSNPKNWNVGTVNDVVDTIIDVGSNGSNAVVAKNLKMSDKKDYAIMIRTVNFTANNFQDNMKYVSKETYDFFSKSKIFGGEIIMNKIGSAGKLWLMPYLGKPVSLGLNQFAIKVKNVDSVFLFWYLESDYIKKKIQEKISGAVTKSITKSAVRELKMFMPPRELQNKFVSIVNEFLIIKEQQKDSHERINKLFYALMQKAFNGELSK